MSANANAVSATEFTNPNLSILFSADQIKAGVAELGRQITAD